LNKPLAVILTTVFLDAVGIGLIMPILPGLIRSMAGPDASSTHYGALLALYALMQFLFSPMLGALSDRYGRRPVLLLSLAGAAADYLLMAVAPNLLWLYVGRMLSGITGANMAVATAYIVDVTKEGDRAKRFGQMGAMFGIGFIIGPLLGGALGEWHLRAPFLAASAMNALNLLMGLFVLPESRQPGTGPREKMRLNPFAAFHRLKGKPGLGQLIGVYAVITLASQVPATLWVLYGQDRFGWTTVVAGLSMAGYGACHALAQAFAIGPLVARLGERKAVLLGLGTDGLALLALSIATHGWEPFVLLPLFAAGGMTAPALQAMLSRRVDESHQGELQGTLASMASLIGVAGPLAVTAIYAASLQTWPGMAWAVGGLVYLLVVPMLFGRRLRESD
jgi:DHA1 family tetracycline resistance protein-like MFS transporter